MNASTHAQAPAAPAFRDARPPVRVGRAGLALVLLVVFAQSLNTTAKFLATEPLDVWFSRFVHDSVYHASIGFAILAAAVWTRRNVPARGVRQYVAAAVAIALATAATVLAWELWHYLTTPYVHDPEVTPAIIAQVLASDVFRYWFVGLTITSAWLYLCTEAEHKAAIEVCAFDAERMDRETAEAHLQMLEAQIEPHFLFNTLAHVRRLYETDPIAGARMLRNLKDYLSIALPRMRDGGSTLGREIDHAVAYLGIQQIRMGRRLAYAIDVPDRLRDTPMPSLMILTLIENAVKHGVGPLTEGGRIEVRATAVDGRLRIDVSDNGRGFVQSTGGGTGLANIRARLASSYGSAAGLSLALNEPGGVTATIVLPVAPAGAGGPRP
ncbi:two-component system, LytTR family, sensor histidine kinase AlgZ [Burkholderiales bacterium]|nr:two-component system, LytTR family, sensor histidine kinase AlgZ [Burkholderiales bacterium]